MTRLAFAAVAVAAAAALTAAPGFAQSLDAFAADHFNSSVSVADRQSATRGTVDPALDALALARFNTSASFDEHQPEPQAARISARNYGAQDYSQLIASAGMTPSAAAGMGLDAIAAQKFVHDRTQREN